MGVDTGGTFTDFVRLDRAGPRVYKLRTSQPHPVDAIAAGLAAIASDAPHAPVVCGSTIATNAVLERKGGRVALVTTSGFEDILAIGRQTRLSLYDLNAPGRRPLVPTDLTFGVAGRIDSEGEEIEPLDERSLRSLVDQLRASRAEAVAVCLLHSYANPRHEARVSEMLRREGRLVSASHEILPEYREYERASTTAVNAYVQPRVEEYLGRLETALPGRRVSVMQSNGGAISTRVARREAVRTILSGPAAGVVGARLVAEAAGFARAISFDAGGTSTDVSVIDGRIELSSETNVGDVPVRVPVIDIHTVGAGGGSIARVDGGGGLVVGPESAGADPGPACYGAGTDFTVTDAHLLLGRLDAGFFLGGRMALDPARALRAARPLARALGASTDEVAEAVVRVANARMERAIRVVSLERGHDPRRFALVAFGGAGGMHAAELAEALGIRSVIVPRHAGVLSALGMLAADVVRDYSISVRKPSGALTLGTLERLVGPLVRRARRDLAREGFHGSRQLAERRLDVRYVGQSYELSVPWSAGYVASFHALHERRYGYSDPTRPTEVVALRVRGIGVTSKPPLEPARRTRKMPRPAAVRRSRFGGRSIKTGVYRWADLEPGHRAGGPAVIAGGEATIVVPPGFRFAVDAFLNVRLAPGR